MNNDSSQPSLQVQCPNLFVETLEPTILSILVFAMADLRQIVREKQRARSDDVRVMESISDGVLQLPMSAQQVEPIIRRNKELLISKLRPSQLLTIKHILTDDFLLKNVDLDVKHITIHHFGDDNADNECVYGILTNSEKKQVQLAFRGSITMQDWRTDAKAVSADLPNPLYDPDTAEDDADAQPETLGVHLGFRDYLYDATARDLSFSTARRRSTSDGSTVDRNDATTTKRNKIAMILDQISDLLDAHPGYTLLLTGHSLGGALAQLTSLEAAVRFTSSTGDGARPPVTCVSIASPRVGDRYFRGAIQCLERQQRLRCLAVRNVFDLVPILPNRLFRGDCCRPNHFCQAGMQLVLKKRSFRIKYRDNDTLWIEFNRELKKFLIVFVCWPRMCKQHNYQTYLHRLVAQKRTLSKAYLNDFYEKEGIFYITTSLREEERALE